MMGKIKAWLEDMSEAVYEAVSMGLSEDDIYKWVEGKVEYYDEHYVTSVLKRMENEYEDHSY